MKSFFGFFVSINYKLRETGILNQGLSPLISMSLEVGLEVFIVKASCKD